MRKALLTSVCAAFATLAITSTAFAQEANPGMQRHDQVSPQPKNNMAPKGNGPGKFDATRPPNSPRAAEERPVELGKERMRPEETNRNDLSRPETREGQQERRNEIDRTTTGSVAPDRNQSFERDHMRLDRRQALDFRNRLERRSGSASASANFQARVGVEVPGAVQLEELPPDIIQAYPEFRGYDYVMRGDEIVIVDPRSRDVVDVVSEAGDMDEGPAPRRARLQLSPEQDEMIRKNIPVEGSAAIDFDDRSLDRVPDTIVLQPLPGPIVAEIPDTRAFDYFVDRDGHIVLVDPETHEVVGVVD